MHILYEAKMHTRALMYAGMYSNKNMYCMCASRLQCLAKFCINYCVPT